MRNIVYLVFMLLGGASAVFADCTCPSKYHCCESNNCVPVGTSCESKTVKGASNELTAIQPHSSFACKEDVKLYSSFIQGVHTFTCGAPPNANSFKKTKIFETKPAKNILFLLEAGFLYSCQDGEPIKGVKNSEGKTVWRCKPGDKKKGATHRKEHDNDK